MGRAAAAAVLALLAEGPDRFAGAESEQSEIPHCDRGVATIAGVADAPDRSAPCEKPALSEGEPMQPDRSAHFDCCIIGAGVVGLAIAHELALRKRSVVILEQEDRHGTGSSARNSEVIHAGIYYPAGSLKATLCVEGRERLYRFCESRGVHHRRIGNPIVAGTQEQHADLELLQKKASANGVTDLQWIEAKALAQLEPQVSGTSALLSPSTGIVDSHGLMLASAPGPSPPASTSWRQTPFPRCACARAAISPCPAPRLSHG